MKRSFILASLTSLLLFLIFPLFSLWPLAFVSLIPLYFGFENLSTHRTFLVTWLSGFFFFCGLLHWIVFNPAVESWVRPLLYLGVMLIAAYLSLFLAASFTLAKWLTGKLNIPFWWAAPFGLVLFDFIRSHGILGFPWGSLGYSLARWTSAIQMASITGVYGVTFWIVLVNGLIYGLIKYFIANRPFRLTPRFFLRMALVLLVFALPPLTGKLMLFPVNKKIRNSPLLNVSLIQGNIQQGFRWDREFREYNWQIYDSLSRQAVKQPVDLLVWPETALPFYLRYEPEYYLRALSLANDLKSSILTGVPDFSYEPNRQTQLYYNSAFLIRPIYGLTGSYAKRHLVPFGERFPYKEKIPFIRNINFGEGEWTPGADSIIFDMGGINFSCMICFESIFPEIARQQVGRGARFLVNITNDGWFGRSGAARQHAEMAVFRAVEQRRAIARCANSGISMFILPTGEIIKPTPLYKQMIITNAIPLLNNRTFYQKYGDLFVLLILIVSIFPLMALLVKSLPFNLPKSFLPRKHRVFGRVNS
ncbi:MAG: apolipoprotein N-acyltransferase [Candidatus Edwardsbacteria bacterium RIFOXYD12_FULL_50_11]|uniref:Apolipoprotein N-acyltransferase n=1 Tax=Candidatus Edwardsbacteria bacterium GWF2_54_11 TaxID=1817851 RepID=A0A1F5RFN3_9BACT|nr:MAG: apolipoprotein N-acyltransferase [Candidatus Edwardsbacteria bacterium RifOxyC12_full_54_24]OGF07983.1 MAG: apolipoprotein N-acyltransferase [Candidatus Edwardsbacteria bacterium RifOxyA12_full_54_48]OGF10231.1 MAG: apolipoprotein N-acyltransferase [Candidatus Edwardsbacteria bacterium GWE2_54_12]OGF13202.1 MAG: apolipoprotein N-acyltransferase [Candidatus Edwardsbacteria bacterium GWF2_54_11]OGF15143.1 MAG: apolipoprotein N-acyltransferase [Candidatus Edwardsbacteria bacterium RIFOXYD1